MRVQTHTQTGEKGQKERNKKISHVLFHFSKAYFSKARAKPGIQTRTPVWKAAAQLLEPPAASQSTQQQEGATESGTRSRTQALLI